MSAQPLDFSDLGEVPIQAKPTGKLDFSDLGDVQQSKQQAPPQSAVKQLFDTSKPLADRFQTADTALSKTGVDLAKGAIKKLAEPAATIAGGLSKLPWIGQTLAPSEGVSAFKQAVKPSNLPQMLGGIGEQAGEMALTGGPLKAGAEALATKLPFLGKFAAPAARIGAEALNTGASAAAHGQPVGPSAALGAGGAALGEAGQAIAPTLMQRALGIFGKDMKYGQTPGSALLENTSGLTPGTIAKQASSKASDLTGQLESAASSSTAPASTSKALSVIDSAIAKAQTRNSGAAIDKLQELRQQLTHDVTTGQPFPQQMTPDKILQLKRGVGDLVSSWTREQRGPIQQVVPQVYRALDSELDTAVPQADQLNQNISSLITGSKAANKIAMGRPTLGMLLRKGSMPGIGAALGYKEGGPKGALEASAGVAALQTPQARIAIARLVNSGLPAVLARGLVAKGLQNVPASQEH